MGLSLWECSLGGLPSNRLMGICCWMGLHFQGWIDHNGVAFSLEWRTRMGLHIFGIWGIKKLFGFSWVWQLSAVEMLWVSCWLVFLQPKAEAMSSRGTNLLTSIHPTLTFYYLYLPVWLDVSHMLFLSECQAVVQVKFQYWSLKCVEMGMLVVSDQVANPYVQKNSV